MKLVTRKDIIELQRSLNALGYGPLVEDGVLGPKTEAALARWDAPQGPWDWAQWTAAERSSVIARCVEAASRRVPTEPSVPAVGRVLDCGESYTGPAGTRRSWAAVDTICLHQMAVRGSIGWKRWTALAIHYAVCCDGVAAWLVDLDRKVPHGHGWNGRSVGFEIEGHYAGVEGDPSTHWTPKKATGSRLVPMQLAEEQIDAALQAIRHAVER